MTANPTYPMFSRQEMDRRLARARDLMGLHDLDALLITGEHNFHYFVGAAPSIGPNESLARPSAFILPAVGDPIIVSQGRDNIQEGTYISEIRDYFDVLRFPYDLVTEALRDRGLSAGRIGAELGQEQRMGLPVGDYLAITNSLPEARFVDAADVIIKTRMVKSDEEVEYMREAARITARARNRLYSDYLTPGVTERQLARQFQKLVLDEGADGTSFVHFQFDIQSQLPGAKHAFHYDRPLEKRRHPRHRHRRQRRHVHRRLPPHGLPRPSHRQAEASLRKPPRSQPAYDRSPQARSHRRRNPRRRRPGNERPRRRDRQPGKAIREAAAWATARASSSPSPPASRLDLWKYAITAPASSTPITIIVDTRNPSK